MSGLNRKTAGLKLRSLYIKFIRVNSTLGLALANIFVGYYEEKLFNGDNEPIMYFRFMDDTSAVFKKDIDCNMFSNQLNSLHSSLTFTHSK